MRAKLNLSLGLLGILGYYSYHSVRAAHEGTPPPPLKMTNELTNLIIRLFSMPYAERFRAPQRMR